VTDAVDLSFPYSSLLTSNLLNGVFFGSIMGLAAFVARRKSKPKTRKYSPPKTTSRLVDEIEDLGGKYQKVETGHNLMEIKGVGPQKALELELAGVKTVADLAKRSPKHLAEKTGLPITQISKWIIEANKLSK